VETDGGGVLAIWHDITEPDEQAVLRWYDDEHHPERVGVPGFLSARRYVAVSASPKFFIMYEATGLDVFGSSPYLERVNNPTAWTRESMVHFRNNTRLACGVAAENGTIGEYVATIRFQPRAGSESALATMLSNDLLPSAFESGDVSGYRFLVPDTDVTQIDSAEKRLRGARPRGLEGVFLGQARLRFGRCRNVRPAVLARKGRPGLAGSAASSRRGDFSERFFRCFNRCVQVQLVVSCRHEPAFERLWVEQDS
jgi:hypothetical protein